MASSQDKFKKQIDTTLGGITPVPDKTIDELEVERKKALLARVRQVREDTLNQKGKVWPTDPDHPPMDRIFVWANSHEARVVSYRAEGYTVVNDGAARIKTNWLRADGTHQWGDLILMEIDKELYEMMQLDNQIRAVENAEGQSMFEAFASESGIPVQRLSN